jgi:hypothetical protein
MSVTTTKEQQQEQETIEGVPVCGSTGVGVPINSCRGYWTNSIP